jgi:hypothetical protein
MNSVSANYKNISASAQVSSKACTLRGIIFNSVAATATIKIWDATTAAAPILLNTITTPLIGPMMFGDGINCKNGIYVTIAVAAMDVTILWD